MRRYRLHMPFLAARAAAALLFTCHLFSDAQEAEQPPAAKSAARSLLHWGWDEPNTSQLRAHVREMEKRPFDGLVFHVDSSRGGTMTWSMWGDRKFDLAEFQHAIDNLQATKFQRLQHRFLRVNVTPGNVDWFDDDQWSDVAENFRIAAQIAKQGQCRGFMFDVEQYESPLFYYPAQTHHSTKSFAQYRRQVRQRGRHWMNTVNRQFPEITILLTFGYYVAQPRQGTARSQARYALLSDFLDGMLDACSAQTRIVDAWEHSYGYREPAQFQRAYQIITHRGRGWSSAPGKYAQHVQAGFGIWMDYDWRKHGWHVADPSANYFTPEQFAASVRAALKQTDQFVWIYSEQPRWWTNQRLPAPYAEALTEIHRTFVAAGR